MKNVHKLFIAILKKIVSVSLLLSLPNTLKAYDLVELMALAISETWHMVSMSGQRK